MDGQVYAILDTKKDTGGLLNGEEEGRELAAHNYGADVSEVVPELDPLRE